MRQLGENFGYYLPVTPLVGRVDGPTGDRRTCVWTLQSINTQNKANAKQILKSMPPDVRHNAIKKMENADHKLLSATEESTYVIAFLNNYKYLLTLTCPQVEKTVIHRFPSHHEEIIKTMVSKNYILGFYTFT